MRHTPLFLFFSTCFLFLPNSSCFAEQTVYSYKTDKEPFVDGLALEGAWQEIPPFITFDPIANIEIQLKSVHSDKNLFFLVEFPDKDESRKHRVWHWNAKTKMYDEGPEREDVFVFKWALSKETEDLSLLSDIPYEADVWYWKACRTDPQGYADDKIQTILKHRTNQSNDLVSRSGQPMFIERSGDNGKSSYKTMIFADYEQETMTRYSLRKPEGSRADVKARGVWQNGRWTIEFSRPLVTGNPDDLNFHALDQSYLFGVSRYEIAGREPNPNTEQPLFGSGDITGHLQLTFK